MRGPFLQKSRRTCKKLYSKKIKKHLCLLNTDNVDCDGDINNLANNDFQINSNDEEDDDYNNIGGDEEEDEEEVDDYNNGGDEEDDDYSYVSDDEEADHYNYDQSDCYENNSTSKPSSEKEQLVEIKGDMNEFKKYLIDPTNGLNKSATEANTIVGRIAKFLIWAYTQTHSVPMEVQNIIPFIFEVLFQKFGLVGQYLEHLSTCKAMKPSTLTQYITNMKSFITWYTLFRRDCDVEYVVPQLQKEKAEFILKQAGSNLEKQNKKYMSTNHTYENDIKNKKLPKEGIEVIRAAVLARLEWAESLNYATIDNATYEMFIGVMIVSFFVFSVQGRISGISDMKVH